MRKSSSLLVKAWRFSAGTYSRANLHSSTGFSGCF